MFLVLAVISSCILGMTTPLCNYIQTIITTYMYMKDQLFLLHYILIYCIIGLLRAIFTFMHAYLWQEYASKISCSLKIQYAKLVIRQKLDLHVQKSHFGLIVDKYMVLHGENMGNFLKDCCFALVGIFISLYCGWQISFILGFALIIFTYLVGIIHKYLWKMYDEYQNHEKLMMKNVKQVFHRERIRLVKLMCLQDFFLKKIKQSMNNMNNNHIWKILYENMPAVGGQLALYLIYMIGYSLGYYMFSDGQNVLTIVLNLGYALKYMTNRFYFYSSIKSAFKAYTQIQQKLKVIPQQIEQYDGKTDLEQIYNINFQNVGFKNVFKEYNLNIQSNELICISGESGIGKSTLSKLLINLLPFEGKITINNKNIKDINLKSLRQRICLIEQNNALFQGTIKQNIKVGDPSVGDKQIEKVVQMVGGFVDIQKQVGAGGKFISQGQRQKVCIARALLRKADLYIFDQSTSSLDPQNRKLFINIIKKLQQQNNTIIIFITHRLTQIDKKFRILKLTKNGIKQEINFQKFVQKIQIQNKIQKKIINKQKQSFKKSILIQKFAMQKLVHFNIFLLSLLKASLFSIYSILVSYIIQQIYTYQNNYSYFSLLMLLMIGFAFFNAFVCMIAQTYIKVKLSQKENQKQFFYIQQTIKQEFYFYNKFNFNFNNELLKFQWYNYFSTSFKTLQYSIGLQIVSQILIGFIVGLYYDYQFTIKLSITIPILVYSYYWKKFSKTKNISLQKNKKAFDNIMHESIQFKSIIKSFTYQNHLVNRLQSAAKQIHNQCVKYFIKYSILTAVNQFIQKFVFAFSFYWGLLLLKQGTKEQITIKLICIFSLSFSSMSAGGKINLLPKSIQGESLQINQFIKVRNGKQQLNQVNKIQFRNLYFKYQDQQILSNFSLIIDESIIIRGKSGKGKTTLIHLLMRFYQPYKGEILINNIPIYQYNLYSLRRKIGFMTQQHQFFNVNPKENILYAINQKQIQQLTLKLLQRLKIKSQKVNIDIDNCSIGQKQRISFIRLLIRNYSAIVFDEILSSVDQQMRNIMLQLLQQYIKQKKIAIFITHNCQYFSRFKLKTIQI